MPLTDAALNLTGVYVGTLATHLSLHTADPSTTGANESSAARVAVTWTVDGDGDMTSGSKNFTGGASNGACTYVGLWSAVSAGTFRGSFLLTGDVTFNSAGEYTVTQVTINGTST